MHTRICNIYIWGVGGSGGPRSGYSCFTWMYLEWPRPKISLVPPTFDDTGSMGFPPCQVFCPPGSTLGDCLPFPCRNREAELKPTTFSSLLHFRDFLSFLFWPPQLYSTFECRLLGLLFNNNIYIYIYITDGMCFHILGGSVSTKNIYSLYIIYFHYYNRYLK